jgi:hypothetical protein
VGVVAVSRVISPIQYCPCFLPPPTLMTTSPIKVFGERIILWPMDLPCYRCVLTKVVVDGRIVVHQGRVLRVVVDVGRRLALVG